MKKITLILLTIIALSCKKDKLEGDYSILEGKWTMIYIVENSYNQQTGISSYDTIYPSEIVDVYQFNFLEQGFVEQIKNNEVLSKFRIVFSGFEEDNCGLTNGYGFGIHLDNDPDNRFVGCVNSDTLLSSQEHVSSDYDDFIANQIQVNYIFVYRRI